MSSYCNVDEGGSVLLFEKCMQYYIQCVYFYTKMWGARHRKLAYTMHRPLESGRERSSRLRASFNVESVLQG